MTVQASTPVSVSHLIPVPVFEAHSCGETFPTVPSCLRQNDSPEAQEITDAKIIEVYDTV